MGYRLGVDLGTTWTSAAVSADGQISLLDLDRASPQIPSVLFLADDGTFLVGRPAERRAALDPDRVVREFKRRVGDPVPIMLAGSPYSPQALTSVLLRWVVSLATERLGEAPDKVVVTHPANWGPYKTDLLHQALLLADQTTAEMMTEPEAAARFYAGHERVAVGETIAVYDLGGGTFDAAVLRKTHDGFELLGTPQGIEQLGGIDFDQAVFAHVLSNIRPDVDDTAMDSPEGRIAWARLRRDCVEAKEMLSADTEVTIPVVLPALNTSVRLVRSEFEEMIRPAIRDTLGTMRRALRSAALEPTDLRAIILVGGSSRIPLVSRMVMEEFRASIAVDTHPKYDVAMGAAMEAGAPTAAAAAALQASASSTHKKRLDRADKTDPTEPKPAELTPAAEALGDQPAAPTTRQEVKDADVVAPSPSGRRPRWVAPAVLAAGAVAVVVAISIAAGGDGQPDDALATPDVGDRTTEASPTPTTRPSPTPTPTPAPPGLTRERRLPRWGLLRRRLR